MAAYTRKQYAGAAQPTTTTSLLSNVGTSVTIASTTGWPSAAGVPFYVVIEPGTIREEKCLATISGSTLTLTRAQDDTTAYEHASGSNIYPVFTANDADEANEVASKLTTKGDLLATTGSSLERLPVGADGTFLKANSSASVGAEWSGITLGTDTSGNYVSDFTQGTGVTITHTPGEGSNATIGIGQAVGTSSSVTFAAVTAPVIGDVTGNASTATALQNARTIFLGGDLSGSASFNGTSNITISASVVNSGITLDEISDVVITTPLNHQSLTYNGTNWVNEYAPTVTYARNAEADALSVGEVVYLFGASGDRASVKRASNSSEATSSKTVGVVSVGGAAGTDVAVTTLGYVSGVSLGSYAAGDVLWLGSTAGTFTTTKPSAPQHLVFIGVVARANNGNGIMYVKCQNGYELEELHNVKINGVTDGQFLRYNSASTVWVNDTINLGTDTAGDYVQSLTAGTGVILSNNSGEGSSPTVAIGQSVATSASVTFAHLIVQGDMEVQGTISRLNETNLDVDSAFIYLNATSASANPDMGVAMNYNDGTYKHAGIFRDSSDGVFKVFDSYVPEPVSPIDTAHVTYNDAGLQAKKLTLTQGNGTAPLSVSSSTVVTNLNADKLDGQDGSYYAPIDSPTFTGTVSLPNNTVALGTQTTGNYVADVSGGTGVTVTHTPGEGTTPSIAIGQDVATSASPTFAKITISGTPSSTTDAVTKSYVDNVAAGINWHEAVVYATSAVLPNTPNYLNGADGVGATLTASSNARLMVDGLNASNGNRILVKNQSSQIQNGIYEVTTQGSVSAPWVLTRADDFNQNTVAGSIDTGEAVYVRLGNSNAGTGYVLTSTGTGPGDRHIPGTDNFVFTQFSGLTATVAGAGLTTDGAVLSVGTASSGRIVVNADDIDLATVTQSNSTAADTLGFAKTVNVDSYGRVTGVVSASVDLSSKANLNSPTFTGTVVLPSTTSIGLISDTEISYLDGVTSAIQTQLDGKASSTTSPVITLGGDLSGSVTLTNLGSGTLNATIAANSVALGADTTGNYMSDLTQGTGVTITHTPGEGSNATIAIGQSVATNANPTFAGATLDAVQVGITSANEIDTTSGNLILDSFAGTVQVDDNVLTTGTITTRAAATQDSVIIQGRAGGTTSLGVTVTPATLSASRTLTLPDTTGTVVTTGDSGTVTSTMIADGTIVNADINASAAIDKTKISGTAITAGDTGTVTSTMIADGTIVNGDISTSAGIALSKLATSTAGNIIVYNASGVPTAVAETGDISISDTGVTAIVSGVIVDADINASAAITHSKLANITAGSVLMGNATNVPTATALSGDVTVNSTGVTAIGTGVIVNADVNASAAIAHSKLANATAGQVLLGTTTTGVVTATTISGDITIDGAGVATIAANSVALGTDTTGNYMSDLTQGTGVTITHTPGEGSNATIAIGQSVATTASVSFARVETTGNVVIGGNLIINGTTETVNATTTTLDDPIITLGGDTAPTVDDNKDRGVEFRWHNGTTAKVGFFGYDDSTSRFTFIPDATNASEVFSGTLGDIDVNNIFINGTAATGTGGVVRATSPTLVTPILGTPQSVTLTNGTDLPISTGVAGLGTGVATFLATPSSANLASAVTGETGSGALVFGTAPTISNLTVSGSASFQGATILLNSDEAGTPSENVLVEVERGTSTNVAIRWNESTDKWQFTNDGTTYNDLGSGGGATVSDTAPATPTAGAIWFKSDTAQTFVYYNDGTSSQWVEIGAVSQNTVADILTTTNATLAATQSSIEIGVIMGAY